MKKRTLALSVLLVLVSLPCGFSQVRDSDEERFSLIKTGVSGLKDTELPEKTKARTDREVKYTAGADGAWFTSDDQVYHYFIVEYDDLGLISKRSCFLTGKDGIPFTPDDELADYQTFDYGPDGFLLEEFSFDGKGAKQYNAVYTYDNAGKKIKVIRYDPQNEEIRSMAFKYDPKGVLQEDAEYAGKAKDLEKYHRFAYDKNGAIIKAMEYHAQHGGAGPDNKWFNKDDVIFATKEFFYGGQGRKSKEVKYIGSGPDGKWFTKDDVPQYYTVFEYDVRESR